MNNNFILSEQNTVEFNKLKSDFVNNVAWAGIVFDEKDVESIRKHAAFEKHVTDGKMGVKYYSPMSHLSDRAFVEMSRNFGEKMLVEPIGYCVAEYPGIQFDALMVRTSADGYMAKGIPVIPMSSDKWKYEFSQMPPFMESAIKEKHRLNDGSAKLTYFWIPETLHGEFKGIDYAGNVIDLKDYKERVEKLVNEHIQYAVYNCYDIENDNGDPERIRDLVFVTDNKDVAGQFKERFTHDEVIKITDWGAEFHNGIIEIEPLPFVSERDMQHAFDYIEKNQVIGGGVEIDGIVFERNTFDFS